jgi:hypothetical protein
VLHGRKGLEESSVVSGNPLDLGLLEHDFGNQHVVGIASPAPGQVAAGAPEPGDQSAPECRVEPGGWGGLRRHSSPR